MWNRRSRRDETLPPWAGWGRDRAGSAADTSATAGGPGATAAAADPGTDTNAGQRPEGPGTHAGEHDPEGHAQLVVRVVRGRGDRQVLSHGRIMARPPLAAAGCGARSSPPRNPAPPARGQVYHAPSRVVCIRYSARITYRKDIMSPPTRSGEPSSRSCSASLPSSSWPAPLPPSSQTRPRRSRSLSPRS